MFYASSLITAHAWKKTHTYKTLLELQFSDCFLVMTFLKYCKYINVVTLWKKVLLLIPLSHGNESTQERN